LNKSNFLFHGYPAVWAKGTDFIVPHAAASRCKGYPEIELKLTQNPVLKQALTQTADKADT
jgi:hypothetical protein